MEDFGSEGWLAAVRAAAEALPEVLGCSVRARLEISGGPGGPCRLGVVIRDGRLVELSPGRPAESDCTVTCSAADAAAILRGELDPAVAYMQGRLKLEGAYERVLFGLRPVVGSVAFAAFAERVRSVAAAG
ncbi:MAG: SCP2 sterol-binding domain-containing protein [bacterium]|nr:SCP2 sterol-binding domain-containing protein [bacterium]